MSGIGGADTNQQTNSQSVTQLPPWVNTAAQQNYALAQNISNRPLQQYQGQLVPNVAPQTQQAWNSAVTSGNAGQDQMNASQAGYLGVLGQQPMNVTAGQLSNTNLQPYMNPYTQDVINKTLPIMQQQLGQQQAQLGGTASQNNAFGGSRFGVAQGVLGAQGALGMGQMAAQLNQGNFSQAQAGATADLQRTLAAQQGNQQAQQQQAQTNVAAAGGLGTLGQLAQKNQMQQFGELASAGQQQQQMQQQQIDAQKNQFNQAWNYPYQQMGVVQSALSQAPYGQAQQGQSTTQTQQSPDMMTTLLGGLTTAGSLFGAGGAFPGVGTALGLIPKAARGLTRVPGPLAARSDQDTTPMMLAPGEAVLNREAAESIGRKRIESLNRAGLSQRQAGPPPGPLASHGVTPPRVQKRRPPPVRGALGG